MPRKNNQLIPGQENLFIGGDGSPESPARPVSTWQEIETNPRIKSPYIIGDPSVPHVNLQARAELLLEAATKQGYANKRELGLQDAVRIEPHATKLWGKYKGKTDTVVKGASKNAEIYEKEAKQAFWKATGLEALVAVGMVSRQEAKALGRVWYRSFNKKFSGDKKPKEKGDLKRQITAQKKIRKLQAEEQGRHAA